MSKNQLDTILTFQSNGRTYRIAKLIIRKKGDIILTLPHIKPDGESTFLVDLAFPSSYYQSSGESYIPYDEINLFEIAQTNKIFKLSYHPDGFTQFSGEGQIISGKTIDDKVKGFGHKSLPIINMCLGPFVGYNFIGNLGEFEECETDTKITHLPIFKRGIINDYIKEITYENNMNLELFIRRIGTDNPHATGLISRDITYDDEILGIFPHPDEGLFQSRVFIFEINNVTYALLARILIWDEMNYQGYDLNKIIYSLTTATSAISESEKYHSFQCFHGRYWKNSFQSKINKNVDL